MFCPPRKISPSLCVLGTRSFIRFKERNSVDLQQPEGPIIAFENLRNKNTLAAFRLTRNPEGMKNEIIMNTGHYIDQDGKKVWEYGRWAQLESLLHEQVHEWQQVFGNDPVQLKRVYHNKEFVEKCEGLGLHPKLGEGYHLKLADGPFALLMKELGIEPPNLEEKPDDTNIDWFKWLLDYFGKERKGTSTLTKWECPVCGLKVRIGIKGNPEIVHDPCSVKNGEKVFFVRADNLAQAMFDLSQGLNQVSENTESNRNLKI